VDFNVITRHGKFREGENISPAERELLFRGPANLIPGRIERIPEGAIRSSHFKRMAASAINGVENGENKSAIFLLFIS
jgi:hypothetical protein